MKDFSYIYWLHILFVGPLFIYIGYTKKDVPDNVFNFLIILGVIVSIYHTFKLAEYYQMKSAD
jgi:hypothetical protein